jgi:hypothetical protein
MAWIPQATERHAELLGEFLALPGMHGNLVPMLIWPHRLWNTGLRYAPQTVIVTRLVLGLILLRNLASFCQNHQSVSNQ